MKVSWEYLIKKINHEVAGNENSIANENASETAFQNLYASKKTLNQLLTSEDIIIGWQTIQQRIQLRKTTPKIEWWRYGNIAATLILIMGVGWLGWLKSNANIEQKKIVIIATEVNEKRKLQLPDGSKIWLHYNSSITYDSNQFNIKKRELILKGKAFFDIAPNSKKPFVITTASIHVQVVGTSFEIDGTDASNYQIKVCTGVVTVNDKNMNEKLFAGNALSYNLLSQKSSVYNILASDAEALKNNEIIFKNDNIQSIVDKLNKWYSTQIKITSQNRKDKVSFTGTIQDDGLESVLKGLSYLAGFHYEIKQNEIIIYPQH